MTWETTNTGQRRFVHKQRIQGKVTSRVFRSKEEADAYIAHRNELKSIERELITKDIEADLRQDRLLQLVDQFIEETLICRGMIKRKGVFQFAKRVNNPVTPEEKSRIRSVKAKTITVHIPSNWPDQSFPEP